MRVIHPWIRTAWAAALLLSTPTVLIAQPTLDSAVVFGEPGDQYAQGVIESAGGVYAVGWDNAVNEGLYLRCDAPLTVPDWIRSVGYRRGPRDVAMVGSDAYLAGWALPPYCGASDGRGGTEGKPALYLYDDAGNFFGCSSTNFFPYRGGESYVAASGEPGGDLYVAGDGEEMGWGGYRTILAAYQADGTLLWKRRYGTDLAGNHLGGTYTRIGSQTLDLARLGGYLYLVGYDREASLVGGPPRQGMLLKVDAAAEPTDPPGVYASNLYPLWSRLAGVGSMFRGVVAFDGYIYAAGSSYVPGDCGSEDMLVEKYDPDGNLIWRSNPAEAGAATLWDVVAAGGRLYAVGSVDALCNGNADASVVEIDPEDGSTSSAMLWGGDLYDRAIRVTTDGDRLFVLGDTRSFLEDGNGLGELDVFLLQLSVTPPDADGDGVLDEDDACPETPAGEVVADDGCSIGQLCPCDPVGESWRNHGAYVSCVAQAAELYLDLGLISEDEKDAIVSEAARSGCGKKK